MNKSDISGEYCEVCEKGYYLGTEDNICTPTFGCAASENGVCKKCKYSFCLVIWFVKNGLPSLLIP